MKTIALPKITHRQRDILSLLYKHRYLTRIQIQAFLKHKDKKTIYVWLKDLRTKGYIDWIYSKDSFVDKSTPAIYYLAKAGINHFRDKDHHEDELRKRYKDKERSLGFVGRSLTIAEICNSLDGFDKTKKHIRIRYFYETEADYLEDNYFGFLKDSELIRPHLCFLKLEDDGFNETRVVESYLLEIFDVTLPQYRLRYRLKQYVTYIDEELGIWEHELPDSPRPIILLVCAKVADLIYAKRRTRGLISTIWDRDDEDRPDIRFTTIEKLKQYGILGEIWEQV